MPHLTGHWPKYLSHQWVVATLTMSHLHRQGKAASGEEEFGLLECCWTLTNKWNVVSIHHMFLSKLLFTGIDSTDPSCWNGSAGASTRSILPEKRGP